MNDDDYDDSEQSESVKRFWYLKAISINELFTLEDDSELCDTTFNMIARVWGDGMELMLESDVEHVIVMVWMTNGLIGNGGFEALFSGEFKVDPDFSVCLDCLRAIDFTDAVDLFGRALLIAGRGPADERIARYSQHPKDLRWKLSSEWFKQAPELERHLAAYIRLNQTALVASWARRPEIGN